MPLYTPFWMTVSAPPESRHTSGLLNVNSLLLRIQNAPHRTVFSEPLIALIASPTDTDTQRYLPLSVDICVAIGRICAIGGESPSRRP